MILGQDPHESRLEQAIHMLVQRIAQGIATTGPDLRPIMERAFGQSEHNGGWTWATAYDAAEAAGITAMEGGAMSMLARNTEPDAWAAQLERVAALEPTRTLRMHDQVERQQFSTPWCIAYAAALAAQPMSDERALEPSAGTGRLIAATNAVARLRHGTKLQWQINELAPLRATLLRLQWPQHTITEVDAAMIDMRTQAPPVSLTVMNPPFSRQAGAEGRKMRGTDWMHVAAAARRLRPGGRIVCITGPNPPWASQLWEQAIERAGRGGAYLSVKASVELAGALYRRMGTGARTRLTVIDWSESVCEKPKADRWTQHIEDPAQLLAWALQVPKRERLKTREHIMPSPHASARARLREAIARRKPQRAPDPTPKPPPITDPTHASKRFEQAKPLVLKTVDDRTWRDARASTQDTQVDTTRVYEPWAPTRIQIEGACRHPSPLVWSGSMGVAGVPNAHTVPWLPEWVVTEGVLSDAQLEAVTLCESANAEMLPGAWIATRGEGEAAQELRPCRADTPGAIRLRKGAMIGDGTGVGKGRQIAAVIASRWAQGTTRAVWCAPSPDLIVEARRDWCALGGLRSDVFALRDIARDQPIERTSGICFVSYATLRTRRSQRTDNDAITEPDEWTRIAQLVRWLGAKDWDGVIAFDEAHQLSNAIGGNATGLKAWGRQGSLQGQAALELQRRVPNARILYTSATGATRVEGLAYAERLGLWAGEGEGWRSRDEFLKDMNESGVTGLEVLARDLQLMGRYIARVLSYRGIEIEPLVHTITPAQEALYDTYAEAFATIWKNLERALASTGITKPSARGEEKTMNPGAKATATSRFEWTVQRFFGHLMQTMKIPTLLDAIESDIAARRSAVIQLVSTGEATMERRLAEIPHEIWDDVDIDMTPKEEVLRYLERSFPVQAQETAIVGDKVMARPAWHEDGRPVLDPEAVERRDAMLAEIATLPPTETVLDAVIERFGKNAVAEVTGRGRRLVSDVPRQSHAERRRRVQIRGGTANISDVDAFMRGDKHVLVYSAAGREGRSYHNAVSNPVHRRRVHYVVETGWQAIGAVQGLGRSHRADQVDAPIVRLVSTDAPGETRFTATIMARLAHLGAITRGDRNAQVPRNDESASTLFDPRHNLEGENGRAALGDMLAQIRAGLIDTWNVKKVESLMRLKLYNNDNEPADIPTRRFLNRVLSMTIAEQHDIYDHWLKAFDQRITAQIEAGIVDQGVEWLRGGRFEIETSITIRGVENDPTATVLHRIKRTRPKRVKHRDKAQERLDADPESNKMMINASTMNAAIAQEIGLRTTPNGKVQNAFLLIRPQRTQWTDLVKLRQSYWREATHTEWAEAWDQEVESIPAEEHDTLWLVTGLLVPVWNTLPGDDLRIRRLKTTDGIERIGRVLSATDARKLIESTGKQAPELSAAELWQALRNKNTYARWDKKATLSMHKTMGARRMELHEIKTISAQEWKQLRTLGLGTEIKQWRMIGIVPNIETLDRLMQWWPGIRLEAIERYRH